MMRKEFYFLDNEVVVMIEGFLFMICTKFVFLTDDCDFFLAN